MDDLPFGMHARVGAPGEDHLHGAAAQYSKTLLELLLDGAYTNLKLRAVEESSRIFD